MTDEEKRFKELICRACQEWEDALIASLPKPEECDHEFSPAFEAKMAKLFDVSESEIHDIHAGKKGR